MKRSDEKTQLDKTLSQLKKIDFTDREKENLRSKLLTSIEERNRKRNHIHLSLPILSAIIASVIFFVGAYLFMPTLLNENHSDQNSNHETLENELTDLFDHDVYLPKIENHSIGLIWIPNNEVPEGFPSMNGAVIAYMADERNEKYVSEEMKVQLLTQGEVIYGEHVNEEEISVLVYIMDYEEAVTPKGELMQIEGINVRHQFNPNDREVVFSFRLSDLVYYITVKLSDGKTDGEAVEIVETFLKQIEPKRVGGN
ncbi:hypothetical protein [Halalkalibacter akibai]|uniref:DUF4367 domain-containing protein n=1 Tax=Halalkalibacter akibai (strain ATCC 43226 / DSM 21942 / CIP 109018 / JCM 9157 / 1139) TaxID=1236973 RepID=W4QUG3_HALA3|nr:hypothetical protein [Halalkalibacter akibai]GAE35537.1 hypothetical protein JCM9157_2649 [Halalkalibacter akibai JCM 9157]